MKESLAHTVWECKYHIVWVPKRRRKVIYGHLKVEIGQIIRKLCEYKGIKIIEGKACVDHIHMCRVSKNSYLRQIFLPKKRSSSKG